MPFSNEDKIIIKHYRLDKGYGRKRLLREFPDRGWTSGGLDDLLRRIDERGTTERQAGSGRPRSARSEENIQVVRDEIVSQEDAPGTHATPSEIAKHMDISESSVRRIAREDLNLKPFKLLKGQKLTALNEEKRVERSRKLLRHLPIARLERTFFSDEKLFKVSEPLNNQNNRVYASIREPKSSIDDERLYSNRSAFPKSVMVSVAVSKLGKTSIYFVDQGAKVNQVYYRDNLLAHMIPEMNRLAGYGHYIFQQDGARAHTAKATIEYLQQNVPELLLPDLWPPNSPDLNPVDYSIWSKLEAMVYRQKVNDMDTLRQKIVECWDTYPQDEINRAVDSFRKRLHQVIAVEGKHIEQYV